MVSTIAKSFFAGKMRLFGLSSLDSLLSLLLLELTWWGYIFFGQFLWVLINTVSQYAGSKDLGTQLEASSWTNGEHQLNGDILFEWEDDAQIQKNHEDKLEWNHFKLMLIFGGLLFLRMKAPLFLLITVLKNKVNQHCQLLRIWFWITIILDLILILFVAYVKILPVFDSNQIESSIIFLPPFVLFRILIWNIAKTIVAELSIKEGSLFPVLGCKGLFSYLSSNVKSSLHVLLSWDILANFLILLSSFSYMFNNFIRRATDYTTWAVLLPDNYSNPTAYAYLVIPLGWALNTSIILITSIQLAGVNKDWKSLTKPLIVLYIIFGVLGYFILHCYMLLELFTEIMYGPDSGVTGVSLAYYIGFGFAIIMEIIQIVLRLFVVEFLIKFVGSSSKKGIDTYDYRRAADRQPLLGQEIVDGKSTELNP